MTTSRSIAAKSLPPRPSSAWTRPSEDRYFGGAARTAAWTQVITAGQDCARCGSGCGCDHAGSNSVRIELVCEALAFLTLELVLVLAEVVNVEDLGQTEVQRRPCLRVAGTAA
jgi:hypothetical protein